jgi:hypothetical protein
MSIPVGALDKGQPLSAFDQVQAEPETGLQDRHVRKPFEEADRERGPGEHVPHLDRLLVAMSDAAYDAGHGPIPACQPRPDNTFHGTSSS